MCHFKVTSLDSVFFKCSPLTESEIELKDQMFFIYLNSILLLNLVAHHSFPGDFASHNGGQAAACWNEIEIEANSDSESTLNQSLPDSESATGRALEKHHLLQQ
jgi:hypothetical protein